MHTPGPTPLSEHWESLVHATQVLALLQIGVVPSQLLLVTPPSVTVVSQPTHWPAMVPPLAQTGLAPGQGPTLARPPPSGAPLSVDPPSVPPPDGTLAVAPGTLQPWHLFCTQKALFPPCGQSLLLTHSTQLPVAAHTGALAGQALPPSGPLTPPQETQVFCAEQKGTPASLLHWLLVLHATHLLFTQ